MQVNIHGSPLLLVYFYTVLVIEKKRHLASTLHTKSQKKFGGESIAPPQTLSLVRGTPPPQTPSSLEPSAPRLGLRLRRSTLPPKFNF